MELTISVPDNVGNILLQRAKANGRDIRTLVEEIVSDQALSPTFDELLSPIRQTIVDSGTTEDELDEFMYSLRRKTKEETSDRP